MFHGWQFSASGLVIEFGVGLGDALPSSDHNPPSFVEFCLQRRVSLVEGCCTKVVAGRWVGRHFGLVELDAYREALVVQKKHYVEVELPHLGPSKKIQEIFSSQGCCCWSIDCFLGLGSLV